jgi:ribose-phosphate pyrophosphokinase
MSMIKTLRARGLVLGLLVTLLPSGVASARGASGRPVVVNATGRVRPVASAPAYKVNLLGGAKRTRKLKVTTFANNEVSTRLLHDVAGREVRIIHGADEGGQAQAMFRTLQAVEASNMARAFSVDVTLDQGMASRYGEDFVHDLFAALHVASVRHVGAGESRDVDLYSRPAPLRVRPLRPTGKAQIWGGASHPELLAALGGKAVKMKRASGALEVELPGDPAGRDVYLLQSKRLTSPEAFHEDMLDLLRTAWEAKRKGAAQITAVLPYLPYSRSDRMDSTGISVGAALLPKLMAAAGIKRVVFYSVHQAQEVGFFQELGLQAIHASGETILAGRVAKQISADGHAAKDLVVVAPDAGAAKRARVFARSLAREVGVADIDVVVASKVRFGDAGEHIKLTFDADISGKVAVAIDDETASGGTLNELGKAANGQGARAVYAAVSHLTGPAYKKIDPKALKKLFVLDTLPQGETRAAANSAIEVVGVGEHLAGLIKDLHADKNVDRHLFLEH